MTSNSLTLLGVSASRPLIARLAMGCGEPLKGQPQPWRDTIWGACGIAPARLRRVLGKARRHD